MGKIHGKRQYNETNTCSSCEKNFDSVLGHPCRGNKYGKFPEKWLCSVCYGKDYQKSDPNSQNNAKKSVSDRRTGNQNPKHSNAKGDKLEKLVHLEYG